MVVLETVGVDRQQGGEAQREGKGGKEAHSVVRRVGRGVAQSRVIRSWSRGMGAGRAEKAQERVSRDVQE